MRTTKLFVLLIVALLAPFAKASADYQPQFSTAGFYAIEDSPREVFSMNPAWRFHKGEAEGAESVAFDDSKWSVVSLPHGIEYLPTEASGCINYQGVVWYRKHFSLDTALKGKRLFLHFEAIMGKSRVFVNGKQLAEHFGGYLPVVVDITDAVNWSGGNIVAVWSDNSDDKSYPPGKPQRVLDYTYFGGIYRDCWLVAHNNVFITDPNHENVTAGGGLFVAFDKVSEDEADILLKSHIRNANTAPFKGVLSYEIQTAEGKTVATSKSRFAIKGGSAITLSRKCAVNKPELWTPDSPTLYNLYVRILDQRGNVVDGYRRRIGIRSIEFKGKEGFFLNGKHYNEPLIGANRHQDFAVVGNAVANSAHWRDAKKLRDLGMRVIRNAHCPQDPAFMDACDELGLFVIDNVPGWQFWNKEPQFEQYIYDDIRHLVRRDRNHPCVWFWEPTLNETRFPASFADNALRLVAEEYPYKGAYSSYDVEARTKSNEVYPIQYTHPTEGCGSIYANKSLNLRDDVTYFTREFGDCVDDWNSHNSPSRVARNWGEIPMLVQAQHYANPPYKYTALDVLYRVFPGHIGGCLWHSFDHQRGYHPDPFYGGVADIFRQPKYSYYMFMSQRPSLKQENRLYETGPMVYIAHEMTPFSPKDVTVYSNCDEVRLTNNANGKSWTYHKPKSDGGMPSPVITFKGVYNFMDDKALSGKKRQKEVFLLAEGLMNGEVVATHKVCPARRPSKVVMWLDNEGNHLEANGSDFTTVVAAIADREGNIKRLNNYYIKFHIEGEGRILGGAGELANPAPVKWGTAPLVVQSTLKAGKIRITASVLFEGEQMPISGVLEFESKPTTQKLIYNEKEAALLSKGCDSSFAASAAKSDADIERERAISAANAERLKEVEKQQSDFGEKR
ncbi:MAG: glycoside hydrolase family 2 protein [Rikenellaceae bacterium]|nr:glycoside hydrolase family 2 protein [Rikenellaceae bacterium]